VVLNECGGYIILEHNYVGVIDSAMGVVGFDKGSEGQGGVTRGFMVRVSREWSG
jgi:hypothetical protein